VVLGGGGRVRRRCGGVGGGWGWRVVGFCGGGREGVREGRGEGGGVGGGGWGGKGGLVGGCPLL